MFQQKMLLSVCLAAAFVTLVAGQMNIQQCTGAVQKAGSDYAQKINDAVNALRTSLTKAGVSSVNLQPFTDSANEITQTLSGLSDPNQTFSPSSFMSAMQSIAASQMKLTSSALNTQPSMDVMFAYMKFGRDIASANMDLTTSVPSGCLQSGQ